MRRARAAALLLLAAALALFAVAKAHKRKDGEKACDKGWECNGSRFCCNETITDYFQVYQFEELFAGRNDPLAHAGTPPTSGTTRPSSPPLHSSSPAGSAPPHHRRQGDGHEGGRRLPRPRRRQNLLWI